MKTTDAIRWEQFRTRDALAREKFVVGVRSTGIYCRPGCPARTPLRRNVIFFNTAEAARGAGFRACRRCHPDQAGASAADHALVGRACRALEAGADEPVRLESLARELSVTPARLRREFRRALGLTPREYADAARLDRFKKQVRARGNVAAAMYEAGYGSASRLYERARHTLGMTPAVYGRGGRGARIGYVLADSPMGRVLVAATEHGVCGVSLGASDSALKRFVREEYPQAELREGGSGLRGWVSEILRRLDGRAPGAPLPLDIRATAFQWRVWQELAAIPHGVTRSYSEVARRIGKPKAARAVARACATNPVAIAIPCHRVVRGDGQSGGYRWGEAVKRKLLRREKA